MSVEAPLEYVRERVACASYNVQDDELKSQALNHFRILVNLGLHATGIAESTLNCVASLDTSTDVFANLFRCIIQ